MEEKDFWVRLEYRVCRELAGLPDGKLRGLWCDGFEPRRWFVDHEIPGIAGQTWICSGSKQDVWQFTLLLPQPVASMTQIDWAALLPPNDVTCWMAIDPVRKRLEIEPAAAVPDLD